MHFLFRFFFLMPFPICFYGAKVVSLSPVRSFIFIFVFIFFGRGSGEPKGKILTVL